MWDRTRGIRKDITQQELCSVGSVELVEQCARFHVHCSARLVAEDPSVFDQKINTENLTKCLQTLKYMYHDLRTIHGQQCEKEPEFRAYVILLNLNDGNFMWEVQQLDRDIQASAEVRFALDVHSAIDKNNYVKFFKLVQSTTYLNACILLRYFVQVRTRALRTITKCYTSRTANNQFPLSELERVLAFEDTESTQDFLETYGLQLSHDRTYVLLNKHAFHLPEVPYALDRAKKVIESKRHRCVGTVICGHQLPPPEFELHVPHDSFNGGNYLDMSEFETEATGTNNASDYDPDETDHVQYGEVKTLRELRGADSDSRSNSPVPNIFAKTRNDDPAKLNVFGEYTSPVFDETQVQAWLERNLLKEAAERKRQEDELLQRAKEQERERELEIRRLQQEQQAQRHQRQLDAQAQAVAAEVKRREDLQRQEEEELAELERERTRLIEEMRREQADRERCERERAVQARRQRDEKERRHQMEELERMQQQSLDREIRETVELLVCDIVDQVTLTLRNEGRLAEIAQHMRMAKMRLFVWQWRERVLRLKRKRKTLDLAPVYGGAHSMEEECYQLRVPGQQLALSLAKRYKSGEAVRFEIVQPRRRLALDLVAAVGHVILNRLCHLGLERSVYWKVALSMPEKVEMPVGLDKVRHVVDDMFAFNEDGIFKTQSTFKCVEFNLCVEKLLKPRTASDNNGILFIGDTVDAQFYNRVRHAIKELRIKSNVPVAIVLQSPGAHAHQLHNLLRASCVPVYEVFHAYYTRESLPGLIYNALRFLADQVQAVPPVECDLVASFVQQHVVSNLWPRVRNHTQWNRTYGACVHGKPNVVIGLHNEAIEYVKEVVFTRPAMNHRDFPNIFSVDLVSGPEQLPCDYRYFPTCWRSPAYQKRTLELLDSLKLPKYSATWPPVDQVKLEKDIMQYLSKAFNCLQTEKTFLKVMAVALKCDEQCDNFADRIESVSWIDLLQVIINELMVVTDFSLPRGEESKYLSQHFVVYETEDLHEFVRDTWYYLDNQIVRDELQRMQCQPVNNSFLEDYEDSSSDDCHEALPTRGVMEEDEHDNIQNLSDEIQDTLDKVMARLDRAYEMEIDEKISTNSVHVAGLSVKEQSSKMKELRAQLSDLQQTMEIQHRISRVTSNVLEDVIEQ